MKNKIAIIVQAAAVLAIFAAGCGGGQANRMEISAGPMPPEGSFDGVYQSPAYGRMEFTCEGGSCVGLYEGERHYGKIQGTINGNLMTFVWNQWNEDLQGKQREATGNGYFRYKIEEEKGMASSRQSHRIVGEWGYGEDNSGNKWDAVKLSDRAKKTLKPRDAGGTKAVMDDDYAASAGFDVGGGSGEEETGVELSEPKKKGGEDEEKADDGLDELF